MSFNLPVLPKLRPKDARKRAGRLPKGPETLIEPGAM
jgi:hypothetical protein